MHLCCLAQICKFIDLLNVIPLILSCNALRGLAIAIAFVPFIYRLLSNHIFLMFYWFFNNFWSDYSVSFKMAWSSANLIVIPFPFTFILSLHSNIHQFFFGRHHFNINSFTTIDLPRVDGNTVADQQLMTCLHINTKYTIQKHQTGILNVFSASFVLYFENNMATNNSSCPAKQFTALEPHI